MTSEEALLEEQLEEGSEIKPKIKGKFIWLQAMVFAAGLALLIFVLYKIGFGVIAETIGKIGWGFLIIVATNFSRHMIRATCIYLAIPKEHRNVRFHNVLAARLAGEAMNLMTFAGPVLGEATKAAMLKKKVSFARSAAAVIVDDIMYYVSVALMMLTGVLLMAMTFGANGKVIRYTLIGVAIGASVMLVGMFLVIKFNARPLSFVLARLDNKGWLPHAVAKRRDYIHEIETNVYSVYNERPRLFYSLLGLGFLAHVTSVLEVFLALGLLGYSPSFVQAYIIEALTKVINAAFSFVPGVVGVYEGGNGIILKALGFTTAIGVALALVRRGAILFWAAFGFAILLWRTIDRGTKTLSKTASEPAQEA
jgi:uncharacterized membrane protein YbhN (UPF0104 family)